MKLNMGTADRIIRIILAAGMATLYFANVVTGAVGLVLLVVAIVFMLTSFISYCPIYGIFSMSTRKK